MAWLDRLNDAQTRRLARNLRTNAREAGSLAGRTARQLADYGRYEGAGVVREAGQRANSLVEQVANYGRGDGLDLVRDTAQRAIDYGRHEGAIIARGAAQQALRAGRAAKGDPLPFLIGAFGIAMFANLVLARRRN